MRYSSFSTALLTCFQTAFTTSYLSLSVSLFISLYAYICIYAPHTQRPPPLPSTAHTHTPGKNFFLKRERKERAPVVKLDSCDIFKHVPPTQPLLPHIRWNQVRVPYTHAHTHTHTHTHTHAHAHAYIYIIRQHPSASVSVRQHPSSSHTSAGMKPCSYSGSRRFSLSLSLSLSPLSLSLSSLSLSLPLAHIRTHQRPPVRVR
jgi:ABC-type nickel/cobalt efflux system permease component RcnA